LRDNKQLLSAEGKGGAVRGLRSGVDRKQRVTGVWVKRQGRWQLVSGQVTPIFDPMMR
jgi:hypothetical protein